MKTIYKKLLFLLLALPLNILAQSTLSGTVTDKASGQPLPGVNVVVEGSNNGVSTDFDGKYELTNVKAGETVVFSYIGYKDASIKFNGQANENIVLEEDANQLQEVVVQVGYGTVKRKDATGAVTVIGTKDFNKGVTPTVENLLSGRIAGVTVNTTGAPGSGSTIRIRGGSSLFAQNDPLIVIDGLPLSNATNTGSTSLLASINPNDIESFSVLKDASATAIYGNRGSNGVILITTKRGSKNLSADYNFQYGWGKLANKLDVFGSNDFRQLITQFQPAFNDPANPYHLGSANTDWQEEIYRRTDYVDNSLSLRGSLFGVIPARLTIGNTYQEGLRLTNSFNRNSISTSLNPSFFTDHLKIRVNANFSNERNRFTDAVENTAIRFDPTQPVYDATSPFGGFFEYYSIQGGVPVPTPLSPKNPVAQLLQTNDHGINNRFYGNVEVDYKLHFFPDLRLVVNLGFDEANGKRTRLVNSGNSVASAPSNGNVLYGTDEYTKQILRNKLLDTYLVYGKTFNKLNVELTGGYSYQRYEDEKYLTGNRRSPNYSAPDPQIQKDVVLVAFFGRGNLSYDDKYLLSVSFRDDGTSRFSSDNRWGLFPAAAFAWKMNNQFFKESKTVTDLKLRLGYGITGQQNLDASISDLYLQQYISSQNEQTYYYFGTNPTPISVSSAYNPDIKWEETTTYNIGLDFGLYSRINMTFDAFYKRSDDLIIRSAIGDGGNFSNRITQNVGSFTTKGLEFGINADVVKSQNFNWNVNFNVSTYERRIDELALGSDIFTGGGVGTGGTSQIFREDFTPYSFFVYKQLYNAAGDPIQGAFADLNGDGIVTDLDRYIYKNPDPDATFGLATNLNWKNLDFSFNVRASVGNRIFNSVNASSAQYNFLSNNGYPSNIPTQVVETNFTGTSGQIVLSDLYVENASFLRVDNITLGYTFPKAFNDASSLRLSLGVQNPILWTKYSGLDPEIGNNGVDTTTYPRQRTILFGANVKF